MRTPGLFAALGHSLDALGRAEEALDAFRQAVALDGSDVGGLSGLQTILLRRKEWAEARTVWGEVLKADPPEHNAWYGHVLC